MTAPENSAGVGANPPASAPAGQPRLEMRPERDRSASPPTRCDINVFNADDASLWGWAWLCRAHREESTGFSSHGDAEMSAHAHERDANHYIHGAEQ